MRYIDYTAARDMSWKLLIKYNVRRLPVKVAGICKSEGLRLISYSSGAKLIQLFDLGENCLDNDGFLFNRIIFFNQKCSIQRQRFTVAHELGHHMLGHVGKLINREPSLSDAPIEQQANAFALRLLCPACVLHELEAYSPDKIAELCNIPLTSAQFRAARMRRLKARDRFGSSALERQVLEQFEGFIRSKKL